MKNTRNLLRNLKSLEGPFPKFDPANVPSNPNELFQEWFHIAIKNGVHEPHSMTLSTINCIGQPDARVLILKDMDEDGWYFASSSNSMKGQQLKMNPNVSLTFYWSLIGRQVRIRGASMRGGKEQSAKDFLERGEIARAIALLGKQSKVLPDSKVLEESFIQQIERMKNEPNIVDPNWCLYKVRASEVEFWQGDRERKHIRLLYRMENNTWIKELLWP
ncbi:MAG TPA: pyridoxamine 5'-phosphate oxidase [Bacillus bacterium]|uniref:Pyridoxamine 5'-phosphate oxidase n=1 Tax=Siminovitchia fordii TaxID=254759 RepID=A0ABQ4KBX7_9BACI|nr:pyridoxal 5'-phosphate synthase [Siminovitchia fordii]GIN23236.1 pyridoxamine 5'-phosphate oxidase [Siminovitchia fordii]HBZ11207.1 pyridoxamine 5'-phosphate oxidase [Bacillus sp. (in: firmicutes)]